MKRPTSTRVTPCQVITCHANSIQKKEANKTEGSILGCPTKALESIDNNVVGSGPRTILRERSAVCLERQVRKDKLEARDTHKTRDLTYCDIDRGASHEAGDSGYRDEFHHPAKAEESNAQNDESAYEC